MPGSDTPRAVFHRVIAAVIDRRPADAVALYAEDAVVTHPFDPSSRPLAGRAALAEHFAAGAAVPREMAARDVVVHETGDPEVIIAEFAYEGRVLDTGRTFTVPCVFVMRIRDGLVVQSRDYGHHLAMAHAVGRVPELVAALG